MADDLPVLPTTGARFTYDGVEYVANRVTVTTKGSDREGTLRAVRLQLDAMPVAEVERRRDNLDLLLAGTPVGEDVTGERLTG